ncbi:MAG: hypothetical protein V5783_02490 [Pontiella sp.]
MRFRILLLLLALVALPTLGKERPVQTLEIALGKFRSATNSAGYAQAAQHFESLVQKEHIRNGELFYTLGNSWFMAGDVGRAILNYRRAEQYLPNHPDLKYNLNTALELKTDLIPEKEPHPLADKLLGWHLKTSTTFRWWTFAALWVVLWGSWFWNERSPRKELRITAIITGTLSVVLLGSLIAETLQRFRAEPGVILAQEIMARKGDGTIYAPAFLDPLHSGTEFQCLEERKKWWHIRLADGQTCWIPAEAGEKVALSVQ